MESIYQQGDKQYPEIILDKHNNLFEISGNCFPEDAKSLFAPILEWFEEYSMDPNPETTVVIKMQYFNTISSKMVYKILQILDEISKNNHEVKVLWYYEEGDDEGEETGQEYEDLLSFQFEYISY